MITLRRMMMNLLNQNKRPHLAAVFRYGTISAASLMLASCDPSLQKSQFIFNEYRTVPEISYSEQTEIVGSDMAVSYITDEESSNVIARERMSQNRIIAERHHVTTNQHTYWLDKDLMTTRVHYVDGIHFAADGRVETEENPLQGLTLIRKFSDGQWSDFGLLNENDSAEIIAAVEKVNNNYALDKGIYPEGEVQVGESWSGTNFVENSAGTASELTYDVIFEKVVNHRGYLCAQLRVHNVLHSGAKGLVLDLKGTAYYALDHGIELDSETSGSMHYMSTHEVGDHIVERHVEGELRIIKSAEFTKL